MKRIFLVIAIAIVGTMAYAQKANVSKANALATAEENPDFDEAKVLIEQALVNPETQDQTKTVWTAAHVYELSAFNESRQGNGHEIEAGNDAIRAYNLYIQAWEMDHKPNDKGKIKPMYEKKIRESLVNIYRYYILVNYAVVKQSEEQWADAYHAADMHLNIPTLQIIKSDPKLASDSVFNMNESYYQIRFFSASWAWAAGFNSEALTQFKSLIGTGYKEEQVYEYISQIYETMGDTVNYVNMLREGAQAVPSSQWLIGNLINYYIYHNKSNEAVEYLDQAIKNNPTAQLYNVLGSVLENNGEYDKALANFNKALELDANYADAYYNLGRHYYDAALSLIEENMNLSEKQNSQLKSNKENINKNFQEALPYFEKAYELDTENSEYINMLKIIYYRVKSYNPKYDAKYKNIWLTCDKG